MNRDWTVEIQHVYREGNRVANKLANVLLGYDLGYHELLFSPAEVRGLLDDDIMCIAFPKAIRL